MLFPIESTEFPPEPEPEAPPPQPHLAPLAPPTPGCCGGEFDLFFPGGKPRGEPGGTVAAPVSAPVSPVALAWAYGVTTVPARRDTLLPRTLASLRQAGFEQ